MATTLYGGLKGPRALLLTLAIAAGLVAVVAGLRAQYPRFLAEHWRKQLDTVPDERAAEFLGRVAQLGEPGIPVLVQALGSPRESLARGGKRALLDEITRWETQAAQDSSPRLVILAEALARGVEQFGPTARTDAADLATRILRWPLYDRPVERGRVIAACEKVLRATAAQRRLAAETPPPDQLGSVAIGGQDRATESADGRSGPERSGGWPDEAAARTGSPGGSDRSPLTELLMIEPPDRTPSLLRQPGRFLAEPDGGEMIPGDSLPSDRHEPPGLSSLPSLRPFNEGPRADDDPGRGTSASRESAQVGTIALMRRLRGGDASAVAEAEVELERRGFTQVDLELARQLFDPDPEVRKRLARLLPELQTVDAVPWLLRLSRDEDSEVRLLAITLLATTGDPSLLDEIRRIAREDPAPRVQRQAARIARQRSGVQY